MSLYSSRSSWSPRHEILSDVAMPNIVGVGRNLRACTAWLTNRVWLKDAMADRGEVLLAIQRSTPRIQRNARRGVKPVRI